MTPVYVTSDEYSVNTVFIQNPEETDPTTGERNIMRKGDTVILTVSSGPAALSMPNLQDKNYQEAVELLKTMGLTQITLDRTPRADFAPDIVAASQPAAGEKVTKDTAVTLIVSGGEATLPKLTGLTFAEAEQLLLQNDLALNPVVNYMDTRTAAEHGQVASQSPDPDQKVMRGTQVSLNIYRYPTDRSLVEVPVDVPKSDETVAVRITLQAAGSAFEFIALTYDCTADKTGPQIMKFNLPDDRVYTCRIYLNDENVNTLEVSTQ
jgi:serine/threonine-protein kinase